MIHFKLRFLLIALCLVFGAISTTGQAERPITKEDFISAIKMGRKEKKTAERFVELVTRQKVDFVLTRREKQALRIYGDYLGKKGLDSLIIAVRDSRSQASNPTSQPLVSQTMTNSPGGYQAGRDVIVNQEKTEKSDVALKLIHPKSPSLIIVNQSDSTARDIHWAVVLWNIDSPTGNNPLQIPTNTVDFIRPRREGGPQGLFGGPLVAPLLKPGQRLIGSMSIDCPDCVRGRTYFVYIVWGTGGWFSEIEGEKSGDLFVPNLKGTLEQYLQFIEARVPKESRIPISEPSISQMMTNSPGAIQAGGNVTINPQRPQRRIFQDEWPRIVALLAQVKGKVRVSVVINDNEAARLAMDIHEVLTKAGWDMQGEPVRTFITVGGPTQSGILLKVRGDVPVTVSKKEPAGMLGLVFRQLNLSLVAQLDKDMPPDVVYVEVGPSPN